MKYFLPFLIVLLVSNNVLGQPVPCDTPQIYLITKGDTIKTHLDTVHCVTPCAAIYARFDTSLIKGTSTYTLSSVTYAPQSFTTGSDVLEGGTAMAPSWDDQFSDITFLPFNFCFLGNSYNQIVVGTNGNISFNAAALFDMYDNWPIGGPIPGSNCVATENCIMAPWNDLYPIAGGTIKYATYGVAPCRQFVISWNNDALFDPGICPGDYSTQQIIMYETSNIIDIYISHRAACTAWNSGFAVTGIENNAGTLFYTPPGENGTTFTATNEGWRFTPSAPPTVTYSWTDSTGAVISTTDSIVVCSLANAARYYVHVTAECFVMNDSVKIIPLCFFTTNNSPCEGDSLKLTASNDSGVIATFLWTGPSGFTSTLQNPFIYPATFADSGWYYVVKIVGTIHDSDSTYVVIHPLPTVLASSNSPLCGGLADTLDLSVTPLTAGETFSWTGPGGFTSALEFPVVYGNPDSTGTAGIGIGVYKVVATSSFGCKDSATTIVDTITRPSAPIITDPNYCQFNTFVNYTTIPAASPTITILWYTAATGGTASGTYTPINTAIPGYDTIWATQKIGSCESPRGRDVVKVTVTPPAPVVTGPLQYCQYIGPIVELSATHTPTGVIWWYGALTGGSGTLTEPLPNINVAGAYPYWVGQTDSLCPSIRTEVTITIHPKPDTPVIDMPYLYCQFHTPESVMATASGAGDLLLWYGPGVTAGTPPPGPIPQTDTPGVTNYYVTETSSFGCVSDSSLDAVHVTIQPQPPLVKDIKYCQFAQGVPPLNGSVDSAGGSTLNWYYNTIPLANAPIPPTDTAAGNYTWYVAQTILGCESDSTPITVTIIYKPVFQIAATQPYVCQFDSITMSYMGPALFAPGYTWTLPEGAYFADGTHSYDSMVIIKFDTATLNNYVHLATSDDSGFCTSDTSIRIKIVVQPIAIPQTKPDVCLGDTVALSMSGASSDAYTYTWLIDNVLLSQSLALNVLASSSNSGGPFSISWLDSGRHIIVIESFSQEGCRSLPWYDTINVHTVPDAGFQLSPNTKQPLCLEDSVLFIANETGYNYSYQWSPEHSFNNVNTSTIWGKVEQEQSIITLTVTDPFGCVATSSMEIDPATCCIVSFPNAFTPNGDHDNDFFRPICSGYHKFHVFRVANRWGQTVFESSDDTPKWDGNYNGVPQDMGTYFYYLKYDCGGKTLEQKGDITLIR